MLKNKAYDAAPISLFFRFMRFRRHRLRRGNGSHAQNWLERSSPRLCHFFPGVSFSPLSFLQMINVNPCVERAGLEHLDLVVLRVAHQRALQRAIVPPFAHTHHNNFASQQKSCADHCFSKIQRRRRRRYSRLDQRSCPAHQYTTPRRAF